ncbi:hypothetical protein [Erythrobacter sp.]|uniref:hypothetical protein n=1 Tax=Erythrobacter sp. TaxID=1042 RepID=UPI002E9CF9C3|nr:hypothetical protein [Erythrobacter sp.]
MGADDAVRGAVRAGVGRVVGEGEGLPVGSGCTVALPGPPLVEGAVEEGRDVERVDACPSIVRGAIGTPARSSAGPCGAGVGVGVEVDVGLGSSKFCGDVCALAATQTAAIETTMANRAARMDRGEVTRG